MIVFLWSEIWGATKAKLGQGGTIHLAQARYRYTIGRKELKEKEVADQMHLDISLR